MKAICSLYESTSIHKQTQVARGFRRPMPSEPYRSLSSSSKVSRSIMPFAMWWRSLSFIHDETIGESGSPGVAFMRAALRWRERRRFVLKVSLTRACYHRCQFCCLGIGEHILVVISPCFTIHLTNSLKAL